MNTVIEAAGARIGIFNKGRNENKFPHKIDRDQDLQHGDVFGLKFTFRTPGTKLEL
jgi:hypothetical protein